ncbi:MAG: hypothetical protein GC190_07485 [Alphaproteobacteria bacterium]|nr:hypothetical protein [Alphaproteobacteria bacterium]
MSRTARAPKIVADEPNIFAEALREVASRRYAKPKKALPRRYVAQLTEGGPVLSIEGASDFDDAAMIFAASAAAPLGHSHLRVCVTDCETGTSQHFHLDF